MALCGKGNWGDTYIIFIGTTLVIPDGVGTYGKANKAENQSTSSVRKRG
jgi:hypothetical protein